MHIIFWVVIISSIIIFLTGLGLCIAAKTADQVFKEAIRKIEKEKLEQKTNNIGSKP